MGWLTGLRELILAMPSLIGIAREILKALHEIEDYRERRVKAEELAKAVEKARKEKDTSDLDQAFKH